MPLQTTQTDQRICPLNGSNDAVWAKDVPFNDGVDTKLHLGVENLPDCRILQPNQYGTLNVNGLRTNKISTYQLYKIWVGESNGDLRI
jgi:hypothetical protein